jgi:hypothetical protein
VGLIGKVNKLTTDQIANRAAYRDRQEPQLMPAWMMEGSLINLVTLIHVVYQVEATSG